MTRNVLSWLEETAAGHPNDVAMEDRDGFLTYGQLLHQAKAIGSFLAERYPTQSPVAVMMEKSPMTVAAMLGCVYAGCFYTPLDPAMPKQRLERILRRLSPACVLCGEKQEEVCTAWKIPCHRLDAAIAGVNGEILMQRARQHVDTDLLYVLFTSGSTGEPKGVAITHRSVIDFVDWAMDALNITPGSSFGNQAPLYFDNSVLDLYGAIRTASRVYFLPKSDFLFPKKLLQSLREHAIDTIFWVPSALTNVASSGILEEQKPALKRVFFCGEVMPCKTLNIWKRAVPEADYVNMYGPTEITDVCAWYRVDRAFADGDSLPLGRPCANTRILLLDGEICVTGTCLAAGYYADPEKTAAAFVQNPLRPGIREIIYRTGDLGEYNDRGELMFLGRRDHQIKRSGYRIELGEIECAARCAAGVDALCCVYQRETGKIACVYTGKAGEKQVKAALKEALPKYMLPDYYLHLDALPEMGNGKIDRLQVGQVVDREYPIA